jgi:protoporphyrin/coproporphyrin ferrochelatase
MSGQDGGVYDALLLVSFGGPEGPDDVVPFLQNVTRGRDIPAERLAEVGAHYFAFGGRSPINDRCRQLKVAVEQILTRQGPALPVYWGNRNWDPYLADTVAQMADDGISRALAFVTSAFGSYSGCRQYREDLDAARAAVGPRAPELHKLRLYYNHPGFLEPVAANVTAALDRLGDRPRARTRLVFTAHSIPCAMAATSDYEAQLREAATVVADLTGWDGEWDLVYQSRSGPPTVPWLEPDVGDHLRVLAGAGHEAVVLVPIGFTSDHMEVIWDLDTQAAEVAAEVGLYLERAATVGTHPTFVAMVRELVQERLEPGRPRRALGPSGPWPDTCPAGHCAPPAPGPARPQRPS